MKDCFLGIDVGTSNIKSILFDTDGFPVEKKSAECSLCPAGDGVAEMDPDEVVHAVFQSVKQCMEACDRTQNRLAGIGLSAHMHSLMAVDRHGKPLTKLILWPDTRAKKEADWIGENCSVPELYRKTGCRVQHPMYPLSKILWLKNNRRDLFDAADKFITIKEYFLHQLFGKYAVDRTLAASQGYYNIVSQKWDEDILKDLLGIDESRLGRVVDCTARMVGMDPECARSMGVDSDTPVVIGSGDGILANIGCGIFGEESLSSTVGTSGALRMTVKQPFFSDNQQTWCHTFTNNLWVAGGAMNNGGLVLKWIRDNFENNPSDARKDIYKEFDRLASAVPPGSDGLIFLPYLTGERSPDWNADARGIVYGLSYTHGKGHFLRAALEGVMYRLYSIYEIMSAFHPEAKTIIANGGYTRSDLWLQIQADIFNKEILVSGVSDASALGAAYLCMVSLGAVRELGQSLPGFRTGRRIVPNGENHEIYRQRYRLSQTVYKRLYPEREKGGFA